MVEGDKVNENQARQLANLYASMGYDTVAENTGGNVWLVTVYHPTSGAGTVFGIDTISHQTLPDGEYTQTINLG